MVVAHTKKFINDTKLGQVGERVVVAYLYSLPSTEYVMDVRYMRGYQEHDIDFVLYTKQKKVIPIEVKTDTMAHITGNIAYEVFSHKEWETEGCLEKTKAKFVFYYLVHTNELIYINVKRLREHVAKNYKGKVAMRAMGDNAAGYLIKIEELISNRIAKKIY